MRGAARAAWALAGTGGNREGGSRQPAACPDALPGLTASAAATGAIHSNQHHPPVICLPDDFIRI